MKTFSSVSGMNRKILKLLQIIALVGFMAFFVPTQVYAVGLVNLVTSEAGMHRITYSELSAKGVELAGLKHNRFGLTSNGEKVAIFTRGQNRSAGRPSQFGIGGYIEFYALAADSLYTDQRAFTLHYNDASARLNMGRERNRFKSKQAAASDYIQTKVVEDNLYYDYLSPSKTDPWHYGQVFGFSEGDTAGTSVNFELEDLVGGTAELEVQVYGIVDVQSDGNDHHFVAKINSIEVGDQQFDGNIPSTLSVSEVDVNNGTNNFQLFLRSIASTPFDAMGLNSIRLKYKRATNAQNDYLEGRFDAAQATVEALSDGFKAKVYRLEEDGSVTRITRNKKRGSSISFNTNGVAADYVVVTNNGYKTPSIEQINDQTDINSGNAEYLIISHNAFIGAELDALVQLRQVDYSVKVVDVAQIYSQYGDQLPSADAIHAYVKFAAANLGTRFVVLVGSDTYDYKQFASQSISFVPTKYAETPGGLLFIRQTPSDASYGDLDADGIPDISVGRLSVRTQAELASVVEKIRDYQARVGYAGRILIAADKEDVGNGVSFTEDVADLIAAIPNEWAGSIRTDFKALPDVDGGQLAHDKIIAAINAGVSVAAYIGHSSQQQWSFSSPPLFRANEIASLNNIDKPTLVTQWGCWNTYYVDPAGNSMADRFLVGGENGAVTVLGASTLTTADGERQLGIELNKRMYEQGMTIGEAVIAAKKAFAVSNPDASDILLGWQIIGDPALVVNP